MNSGAGPARTTPLAEMLRDFGEDWDVQEAEGGTCIAVSRPKPVQPPQPKVLTAPDFTELRKLLENENARQEF